MGFFDSGSEMKMAAKTEWSPWFQALKRHAPSGIKSAVKEALRRHKLSRTLHQLLRLPPGEIPSRAILTTLRIAWGNEGWSGKLDYLEEVARAALGTTGPILECGSGLTTIILGLLAGQRGIEVWSLEETEEWQSRVCRVLERHGIPGVKVCLAPLQDYNGFTWYALPSTMPQGFTLVVCDGPGTSYASRYGLLPVAGHRLAAGASILVDDSSYMADIMAQWLTTMRVELVRHGPQFSVMRTVRSERTPTPDFALSTAID